MLSSPRHKAVVVALFFTTLHRGGTESQAMLLLSGYDKKIFSLRVYSLRDGPLRQEIEKLGIPVRVVEKHGRVFFAAKTVREWLVRDKVEILQSLLWHTNIISRFAVRGTETKLINSVRWAERRARDIVDYFTRANVDWWIANSKHGAALARLPSKSTIVTNGLSDKILRTSLSAWRPVPKTAIMVGQFRREKRYDLVILAAKQLPDWTFKLVGEGPTINSMKSLSKKLAVTNVQFLGKRDDVDKLLLKSSVSLLISRSEGTPNVALESMALGVPFIGSNIPAHRELLSHGRGIIVPKDNFESLVSSILHVAKMSKSDSLKMRKVSQSYVQLHFNEERMLTQTQDVWSMVRKL